MHNKDDLVLVYTTNGRRFSDPHGTFQSLSSVSERSNPVDSSEGVRAFQPDQGLPNYLARPEQLSP